MDLFDYMRETSKEKESPLASRIRPTTLDEVVGQKHILGKEYGITASRGKWVEKKGIKYMPTWHPAALLRDETKKIDFVNDLLLVMKELKYRQPQSHWL